MEISAAGAESLIDFKPQISARRSDWIARRRDLHRHPELGFQEVRTAGIVAGELTRLGLEVQTGVGKTGVVGLLEGDADGPTVLVRADMDALPVTEENDVDYASQTPGTMHACGHDGHTAVLLAVAELLSARRSQIAGRVKFIFQPAEEIGRGASAMIEDGVLRDPAPDVALGLHLWNEVPVGSVVLVDGPLMASAGDFEIRITGRGG
ncbi:MAG: amidohydrolase, partial [Chloroflexi bacterium]